MTSLRRQAARGVLWTGTGSAVTTTLQFIQWAVLARLLAPEDFGLMSMAMIVIGMADAFTDMGVSSAIIHRRDATRRQLSSLYWLNIVLGVVVFLLVAGLSPMIAKFFNEPEVARLLMLAAFVFLIAPLGQQFRVLLEKELQFNRLARIDMIGAAGGAGTAITTALLGYGVYSLIWGALAGHVIRAGWYVAIGWRTWRPQLRFRVGDLDGYLSFGLFQTGERIVNSFAAYVDYLIIGRFLVAEALGFYTLAYQLVVVPLTKLNPVLTRVAFPLFSIRQDDDAALRRGYMEMTRLLAFILCPAIIGLAITAPLLIPVLVGEAWTPSIVLLQILSMLGLIKALGNPSGSILLAKGRPDIGFIWNFIIAIINTVVFLAVVDFGLQAVAWAYMILSLIYFVIFHRFVLKAVIGLRLGAYLASISRPALLSVIMGLIVGTGYVVIMPLAFQNVTKLVCLVATGILTYATLALVMESTYLSELKNLLIRRQVGRQSEI